MSFIWWAFSRDTLINRHWHEKSNFYRFRQYWKIFIHLKKICALLLKLADNKNFPKNWKFSHVWDNRKWPKWCLSKRDISIYLVLPPTLNPVWTLVVPATDSIPSLYTSGSLLFAFGRGGPITEHHIRVFREIIILVMTKRCSHSKIFFNGSKNFTPKSSDFIGVQRHVAYFGETNSIITYALWRHKKKQVLSSLNLSWNSSKM